MRVFVAMLVTVSLMGCRGHSGVSPAPSPASSATHTSTPIPGASYVYRLDTFEKVYEAFVTGRIPAALAGETAIVFARARIDGFFVSEDLPQNRVLHLATVSYESRTFFSGADGPDYEWWFVTRDGGDEPRALQVSADRPELRVGLRNVDGAWGLYVDTVSGWQPVAGTFAFGELEVSVSLRIDESWPLRHDRLAYMRAVVRHRPSTPQGYDVGGVYPEDLSWNIVSE